MANQEVKVSESISSKSSRDVLPENSTINNFTDETEEYVLDKPEEFLPTDAARDKIKVDNNVTELQPEVIYKTSRNKKQTTTKKRKNYKHANKVKKSLKKYNNRNINKKLERYMEAQINDEYNFTNQISSKSISKNVSLCPMVKEVPAKESLVENLNFAKTINENRENTISLSLYPKASAVSNDSQNTIILKKSVGSFENTNSGSMFIILDEPIKSNIINISSVQIDNLPFSNRKSTPAPSYGSFSDSNESNNNIENQSDTYLLTSAPESIQTLIHTDPRASITSSEASVDTLINDDKKSQLLILGRDLSESSLNSLSPPRSSTSFHMEHSDNSSSDNCPKTSLSYNKQRLMDTVIDLGMFPQVTTRRSSNKFSDVIVTGRILTNYSPLARNNKEKLNKDDQNKDSRSMSTKNVVQKSSKPSDTGDIKPKNVKLPNHDILKDLLKNLSEKNEPMKNQDEWQTEYPSTIAQLWENLIVALNTKVQKIEKSLTDKILIEMKTSLDILDRLRQHVNIEGHITTPNNQKLITFHGHDQDMQCSLLEPSNFTAATETAVSNIFITDSKEVQYNIEPSFEVLKPVLRAAGDSEAVITDITVEVDKPAPSTATRIDQSPKFSILNFIKENVVVLAGAPIFIVVLVCVYLTINSVANSI